MAFKTFAAGLLPASDMDVYLMQQAIIVCTSSTRPSGPPTGMRIWQTDTLSEYVYNGSTWVFFKGLDRFVRKTSDESVISTATLQDDDALFVSVAANAVYVFELYLISDSATGADLKAGFSVPSGAALYWSTQSPHTAQTDFDYSTISITYLTAGSAADLAGYGTGAQVAFTPRGLLVTSSTSGTFQLRWAQSTSTASNTTVRSNSYIMVRRVA